LKRGDETSFGVQENLKRGYEKCFSGHMTDEKKHENVLANKLS
jgi:hypothetical protein